MGSVCFDLKSHTLIGCCSAEGVSKVWCFVGFFFSPWAVLMSQTATAVIFKLCSYI